MTHGLRTFNPFDPVGSWLDGLIDTMVSSASDLLGSTLTWITDQAAPDFTMRPLVSSYTLSLTLAVTVILPVLLISHFIQVARGKAGASELWDVLLFRIPRALIVSMFALTIGTLVARLSTALSASIVNYTLGEAEGDLSESISTMLPDVFLLLPGGQGVAVIMGVVMLLATVMLAFSAVVIKTLGVVLMVMVPFAAFADASARYRTLARKFVGLFAVWAFALPAQLLLFGLFFQILAQSLDAAALSEVAGDGSAQEKFDALTWLVVSAIAFIVPALAPLGMLKLLSGVVGHTTDGGERQPAASLSPAGGSGAGSAQQASSTSTPPMSASAEPTRSSVSGAPSAAGASGTSSGAAPTTGNTTPAGSAASPATAGASGRGAAGAAGMSGAMSSGGTSTGVGTAAGGASTAGASTGAAASGAGTAGAAAGAGAVSGGVGTAVVAAGAAAARMSQAARMRGSQSVQSAAMLAMHAEGNADD